MEEDLEAMVMKTALIIVDSGLPEEAGAEDQEEVMEIVEVLTRVLISSEEVAELEEEEEEEGQ